MLKAIVRRQPAMPRKRRLPSRAQRGAPDAAMAGVAYPNMLAAFHYLRGCDRLADMPLGMFGNMNDQASKSRPYLLLADACGTHRDRRPPMQALSQSRNDRPRAIQPALIARTIGRHLRLERRALRRGKLIALSIGEQPVEAARHMQDVKGHRLNSKRTCIQLFSVRSPHQRPMSSLACSSACNTARATGASCSFVPLNQGSGIWVAAARASSGMVMEKSTALSWREILSPHLLGHDADRLPHYSSTASLRH